MHAAHTRIRKLSRAETACSGRMPAVKASHHEIREGSLRMHRGRPCDRPAVWHEERFDSPGPLGNLFDDAPRTLVRCWAVPFTLGYK